ncbi:hypothetical protein DUI87_21616 [Hirundo rustica rustica]|uniref:Uncharacterized protein n=1 Tax=Hirundo rustica rustica TaxID=333673 RepID=A0A3M0JL50_HIRRU|nr:hypothetical protein DUI87_21616 [Hirundo rustica rustica]
MLMSPEDFATPLQNPAEEDLLKTIVLNPPIVRHFGANHQLTIKEKPLVMVRNPEKGKTEGPHKLVT